MNRGWGRIESERGGGAVWSSSARAEAIPAQAEQCSALRSVIVVAKRVSPLAPCAVGSFRVAQKLFYTGPVINVDMLVMMLEKHGIVATSEIMPGESDDPEDLNRRAQVFVPEEDYAHAHQLFYVGREDEL
jgi:hypothetical protein